MRSSSHISLTSPNLSKYSVVKSFSSFVKLCEALILGRMARIRKPAGRKIRIRSNGVIPGVVGCELAEITESVACPGLN